MARLLLEKVDSLVEHVLLRGTACACTAGTGLGVHPLLLLLGGKRDGEGGTWKGTALIVFLSTEAETEAGANSNRS